MTIDSNPLLIAIAIWGLGPIFLVVGLLLHHRMILRLRSHHHVLWLDLGTPTLREALMTMIGRSNRRESAAGHLTYYGWLATNGFREITDDIAALTGKQLRVMGRVCLLWGAIAVFVTVWTVHKQ